MGESVSGEQAGAARWLSVHDDLLRGLTHALSNRVGTIGAIAHVIAMRPANLEESAANLREEAERLDTLLQLIRLLPRSDAAAEPVVPTDTTAQALELYAHHPDVRDVTTSVTVDGDLQPAYAAPGVLVMAVTVILDAAHRAIGHRGRINLTISSSTEAVRFAARAVHADGTPGTADDTVRDVEAINWLLRPYGGFGDTAAAGAEVTIPTLQAARRMSRD